MIYHYHIWKLEFFDPSAYDKNFMYLYLSAVTQQIKASSNGIAMIHMTKERMEKLVVLFSPLPEQHRIVAKVENLMALCDALEKAQTAILKTHQTAVKAMLQTLTGAATTTDVDKAGRKLATHFDTLFCTEDSIDQLQETVLGLAIRGRSCRKTRPTNRRVSC